MVRFGASKKYFLNSIQCCFNSSMVRFGVALCLLQLIERFVSIPVWCDLEQEFKQRAISAHNVSIPVWCDLEIDLNKFVRLYYEFQFQYGAIWSIDLNKFVRLYYEFQFQYGAIWRACCKLLCK